MCWLTVAYGVCFGEETTRALFFVWGYGLGITWLLTEPFVIIFFTVLPQLCLAAAGEN